jgi:hypothetical protein
MDGEWLLIGSLIAGGLIAGAVVAKRIEKKKAETAPPLGVTQTQPVLTPKSVQYPQTQLQSHVIQSPITIGHTEKPPPTQTKIPILPPPGRCWGPTLPTPGMPPIYLPQYIICNFPVPPPPYPPGTIAIGPSGPIVIR